MFQISATWLFLHLFGVFSRSELKLLFLFFDVWLYVKILFLVIAHFSESLYTSLSETFKSLRYVLPGLRTNFEIFSTIFLCQYRYIVKRHLSVITIDLVSKKQDLNIFLSVFLNFLEPELSDILETLLISYIVHNNDSLGAFVVSGSDCSEPLLAGGVPNLQFYTWFVGFIGFGGVHCLNGSLIRFIVLEFEIYSNGGEVRTLEIVICEPSEERWLSDGTVSDQDYFVSVIVHEF